MLDFLVFNNQNMPAFMTLFHAETNRYPTCLDCHLEHRLGDVRSCGASEYRSYRVTCGPFLRRAESSWSCFRLVSTSPKSSKVSNHSFDRLEPSLNSPLSSDETPRDLLRPPEQSFLEQSSQEVGLCPTSFLQG